MPYLQHARRHRLGGTDPIEGMAAEAAVVAYGGTPITVAAAGEQIIPYIEFDTTSTDVFGTVSGASSGPPTNTTGDNGLLLQQPGLYLAIASFDWDVAMANTISFIDVTVGEVLSQTGFSTLEALATGAFNGTTHLVYPYSIQATYVVPGAYGLLSLKVQNKDVSSHDLAEMLMSCMYWPNDKTLESIF